MSPWPQRRQTATAPKRSRNSAATVLLQCCNSAATVPQQCCNSAATDDKVVAAASSCTEHCNNGSCSVAPAAPAAPVLQLPQLCCNRDLKGEVVAGGLELLVEAGHDGHVVHPWPRGPVTRHGHAARSRGPVTRPGHAARPRGPVTSVTHGAVTRRALVARRGHGSRGHVSRGHGSRGMCHVGMGHVAMGLRRRQTAAARTDNSQNDGQTMVKRWSNDGQAMVKRWSKPKVRGQIAVESKSWTSPAPPEEGARRDLRMAPWI